MTPSRSSAARTPALLRSAYLLTGDQYLAEDLVQTALAQTAMRWDRVVAGGNPEPYVRAVLYNEHVSWWRRRRPPELLAAEAPEPGHRAGGGDLADQVVERDAVRRALLSLPPRQRAVLVLRYFEDHTEGEVAALLGCGVGTVRSRNARGLRRLRDLVPGLSTAEEVAR